MKTARTGSSSVGDVEIGLEARDLPPERVASRADVGDPEVVAVEQDHPGARAEDRLLEPAQRLVEPVEAHQPRHRRRLAARHDQPVEPVELLGQAHLDRLGAEPAQHGRVLAKVSLHGEDADSQLVHPRIVEAATRRPAGRRGASLALALLEPEAEQHEQEPDAASTIAGTHSRWEVAEPPKSEIVAFAHFSPKCKAAA